MKKHMEETAKEDRKSAHFCVSRDVIDDDLREAEHVIYNNLRSVREKAHEAGRREAKEERDELLEFAKEAVSWFCDNWEGYENHDIPTCGECLSCKASALIAKIEGKK